MKGTYTVDGAKLAYKDTGAGMPVVFLHPTPLDGEYWRPLTDALGGVRAIVPDLRGHGGSELGHNLPTGLFAPAPGVPVLTMKQLADDVLALLHELDVHEAVFVGCSIGGYVLLELWRQAPQTMRGLAFICSKPQPDLTANAARRAATIAQAQSDGCGEIFDAMARNLIGATAQERHPEIVARLRAQMTLTPEAVAAVQAGLATHPDFVPIVASIQAPVLAITGGEDPGVSAKEMAVFRRAPGGCESHMLPDAGHFAAYEQPEKVAALLAEWLRQMES
jgi:pimeloyl-ACP methyl ester carboxylesterase